MSPTELVEEILDTLLDIVARLIPAQSGSGSGAGLAAPSGPLIEGPAVDLINVIAQSILMNPMGMLLAAAIVVAVLAFVASVAWNIPKAILFALLDVQSIERKQAQQEANAHYGSRSLETPEDDPRPRDSRSRVAETSDEDPRPDRTDGSPHLEQHRGESQ